jgi:hypothetical protein
MPDVTPTVRSSIFPTARQLAGEVNMFTLNVAQKHER